MPSGSVIFLWVFRCLCWLEKSPESRLSSPRLKRPALQDKSTFKSSWRCLENSQPMVQHQRWLPGSRRGEWIPPGKAAVLWSRLFRVIKCSICWRSYWTFVISLRLGLSGVGCATSGSAFTSLITHHTGVFFCFVLIWAVQGSQPMVNPSQWHAVCYELGGELFWLLLWCANHGWHSTRCQGHHQSTSGGNALP